MKQRGVEGKEKVENQERAGDVCSSQEKVRGSLGRSAKAGVRKQNRKTDGDWTPGGQNKSITVNKKRILLKMRNNKKYNFYLANIYWQHFDIEGGLGLSPCVEAVATG